MQGARWSVLRRCALSSRLNTLLLLAACGGWASASPWTVTFGNCSFSGDTDGAPLVREGSCPDQAGNLDLDHKGITEVTADAFEDMGAVNLLELDGNLLATLPEGVFSGLLSLSELNLEKNELMDLPSDLFRGLSSLSEIDLQGNKLTTLPSGIFSGLSALSSLYLQENQLTTLPSSAFLTLSSLSSLWLNSNQLKTLPSGVFSGLSALSSLYLQDNQLTTLPSDVFSGLSSLSKLSLQDNRLTTFPSDVFSGFPYLSFLGLAGNKIATIPSELFSGLSSLSKLDLHNNQLSTLPPDVFSGLSALRYLDISENTGLVCVPLSLLILIYSRVLTSYSGPSTLCETRSSTSAPSNVSFASNSSPSNSSYNPHTSISSSSSDWGNYGGIISSTLLALGCLLAACWCVRRRQLKARAPLPRDEGSASTQTETSQELRLHILQLEETVGQLEKTVKRAQESIVFDQGGTLRGLRKDFEISKDRDAARTDGSGRISKGRAEKEKTVSRAEYVSPTNGSAEVFSCDFKCGFEGGFERVSAHESTCRFNPAAATSAGYVAGALGRTPRDSDRLPAQLTVVGVDGEAELPPGWTQHFSKVKQRTYYRFAGTGEVTWTMPTSG